MAHPILAELAGDRPANAPPIPITLSFVGLTGVRCCVAVFVSNRNNLGSAGTPSATWEDLAGGGPVTIPLVRKFSDATNMHAVCYLLVLGDLTNVSGDVVINHDAASTDISMTANATVFPEIFQAGPVRVQSAGGGFSGTTVAVNLNTLVAGDICMAIVILNGTGTSIVPVQPEVVGWDPSGPAAMSASVSRIAATGSSESMVFDWGFSRFTLAVGMALIPDITPGPVISGVTGSRGPGLSILPGDTNITVDHTNGDLPGVTKLYLADDSNFATATLVEQTISGVAPTTLNWDAVTFGSLQHGPLFLFLETDSAGTPVQSDAFGVIVSEPEVLTAARIYKCTGSEFGPVLVTTDLPFVPHGYIMRVNATTVRGAFNPQWVSSVCIGDDNVSMGECSASQHSPAVHKRAQANGANSLIVLDPSTAGADNYITATPSLTDTGMSIDFVESAEDFELLILFFGGNTYQAEAREIQINDLSVSGLAFAPDIFYISSTNQTAGASEDTTFSRQSMGWSKGTAVADNCAMVVDNDSGSARNSVATDGVCLAQIGGTSVTWTMTVASFDSDGITWTTSGTGLTDSAYVLFMNLDGAQSFVAFWAKETGGVNGTTENLPDTGIDDLGWLWQMNCHRGDENVSPAIGSRWDSGLVGLDGQHSELNLFNPAAGTGTAECRLTFGLFVENSSGSSTLTLQGTITKFARIPEIRWDLNVAEGVLFGLAGWESLGDITGERGVEASFLGALGVKG